MSSPESSNVYEGRPNEEALLEKRKEYVYKAIESVLARPRSTEKYKRPWLDFNAFTHEVQSELREKSGLDKQIPESQEQKNAEDFEKEFNPSDLTSLILDYCGLPHQGAVDSSGQLLSIGGNVYEMAMKTLRGKMDTLREESPKGRIFT